VGRSGCGGTSQSTASLTRVGFPAHAPGEPIPIVGILRRHTPFRAIHAICRGQVHAIAWHLHCQRTRLEADMIDREKVLAVLTKRFPDGARENVAAAANAIVGLGEEWEEVTDKDEELGYHYSPRCVDNCYLAQQAEYGESFRLFRRRAVKR
jgi:hypothetical protein